MAALVLLAAFVGVVLQNAWVCDDAFITWRTVDHFVHGRGLVYNLGERVQAYTHPLWLFTLALAHLLSGEAWWTTIVVSALLSLAAMGIFAWRLTRGGWVVVPLLLAASLSRAFVEYSTSGLENPLSHLILVLTACWYFGRRPSPRTLAGLAFAASLAALTRPDLFLVVLPFVWTGLRDARRRGVPPRERVRALAIGLVPLAAWEGFSLLYYGALVPNTALAKLGVGLARTDLLANGVAYLRVALVSDPLTPAIIVAALVLIGMRRDTRANPIRWAIGLHLAYLIWIGGDFMSGRFLTVPFVLALIGLGRIRARDRRELVGACLLVVGLAALGERAPPMTTAQDHRRPEDPRPAGDRFIVGDERSYYAESSSLLAHEAGRDMPDHRWRQLGERGPKDGSDVVVFSTMGFYGYHARPELHVIDGFALADPLLSRLPMVRRLSWRPGHYSRRLPPGYLLSRRSGTNQLEDPALAQLYDAVELVTRAPLFSPGRMQAIWRLNTGHYTRALDRYYYRHLEAPHLTAREATEPKDPVAFRDAGLFISFERAPARLELVLSSDDAFELRFRARGRTLATRHLEDLGTKKLTTRAVDVPPQADGFDTLHVVPLTLTHKQVFLGPAGR